MSKEKQNAKYKLYDRVYVPGILSFYGTITEVFFEDGQWWYKIKRDDYDSYYYKTDSHIQSL